MTAAQARGERLALAFLGLHPDRKRKLLDRFGTPGDLMAAVRRGRVEGIGSEAAIPAEQCREAIGACGCRVMMLGDPDYPGALAGIEDPPDVLFVVGSVPLEVGVGVVGTRRSTRYGTRIATAYGEAIARAGWPLVSGLARGVDAAAHLGTVAGNGIGVAVLGSGPDITYPREHRPLRDRLVEMGGAAITEYPPGTPPHGWRFPPRNRIISGLSAAVVVVEAAVTGGALVTAARGLEQGRVVFAVPGDIDREASAGCNRLIRDGAVPVFEAADLIEALSLVMGPPRYPPEPVPTPDGESPEPDLVLSEGTTVEALGRRLGVAGSALVALIGRLEAHGAIRRDGEWLLPGH